MDRTTGGSGDTFEDAVLPHLDAAYRLARWLTANDADAEDVVQEASLRALRYFGTFSGGNGRAWFLRIVRNTCWTCQVQKSRVSAAEEFDEEQHEAAAPSPDPETLMLRADLAALIDQVFHELPDRFRELLVLRELEGLSYQELSGVLEIPIGTVMSGLSRARRAFRRQLNAQMELVGSAAGANTPDPVRDADRRTPAAVGGHGL